MVNAVFRYCSRQTLRSYDESSYQLFHIRILESAGKGVSYYS